MEDVTTRMPWSDLESFGDLARVYLAGRSNWLQLHLLFCRQGSGHCVVPELSGRESDLP
jgi:hypothetical protein